MQKISELEYIIQLKSEGKSIQGQTSDNSKIIISLEN